jgi:secretion/DNA translocation related TadE-like protein
MVWVAAVVLGATTAAVVWGGVVVARHRATRTADLAALAAARDAAAGLGQSCSAAVRVAGSAGADVVSCQVLPDGSVLVVVELPVPVAVAGLDMPPARARARAGASS